MGTKTTLTCGVIPYTASKNKIFFRIIPVSKRKPINIPGDYK